MKKTYKENLEEQFMDNNPMVNLIKGTGLKLGRYEANYPHTHCLTFNSLHAGLVILNAFF